MSDPTGTNPDLFERAINPVLDFEGGYVNDKDDPGGETKYGISKAAYPNVDIKNLTLEAAKRIYRRDYWDAPGYSKLPELTAIKIFEIGVNAGIGTAGQLLQRALNHLITDADLIIDGQIGQATIAAATRVRDDLLVTMLRLEQRNHYLRIVGLHPARRKFLRGWLRRAAS